MRIHFTSYLPAKMRLVLRTDLVTCSKIAFGNAVVSLLLLPTALCAQAAQPVSIAAASDIVKAVDKLRQPPGSVELVARITSTDADGTSSVDYNIKTNGVGSALLTELNAKNRGRKVLSTADGIWIYFPNTRRAIRITPMQQLYGDASIGDVLRTQWSSEYKVGSVKNDIIESDGQNCIVIILNAAHEDSTYKRVDLFVNADTHMPVSADLYVFGGKLLKRLHFSEVSKVNGHQLVATMKLDSLVSKVDKRTTVFTIRSIQPLTVTADQLTLHALELGR